tara:strand:+ start:376 stop:786 length:411 start_codon:yes stop_codon:yes gene_type:complete
MQTLEFKILFVGNTQIGKTTFIRKLINENNTNIENIPTTIGVDVKPIDIYRNRRKIRLNIWDCSGNPNFKGLGSLYYMNANGVVLFKDDTDYHENVLEELESICPNVPILHMNYNKEEDNFELYKNALKDFAFQNL